MTDATRHAMTYPSGCPDLCDACVRRLALEEAEFAEQPGDGDLSRLGLWIIGGYLVGAAAVLAWVLS